MVEPKPAKPDCRLFLKIDHFKMVDKVLGAKVRIEVNEEGSYEGYVHNIDEETSKLTLVKVISCSTGTRLHGLHHFFPKEITHLTVLEQKTIETETVKVEEIPRDPEKACSISQSSKNHVVTSEPCDSEEINKMDEHKESSTLNKRKETKAFYNVQSKQLPSKNPRQFSKRNFQKGKPMRRDPSDEGPSLLQRRPVKPSNYYSEVFADTTDEKENFTVNPPDVVMIDSLGETFEKAVAYISRQRVVGVAWEGIKVGRFGKLCIIQIGCNKSIYIFDIVSLGGRAFDRGLADIMDSGDILKVIHNCRHFSDSLYHQYGVSLVNVFDTQVADVIIYRNEMNGKLPRQTSSLISSLYEYLDLSPDEYHFHKIRLKHTKNDEYIWQKRPLPKDLIDAAAKTVMYLRELRLAQMERMMEEFIFGVDIYLTSVRDACDEVVKKKYASTALPEMFHQLHKQRDRPRYRQLDPELDDNNEQMDPRQAWQEGHTFLEKYEKRGMRVREHKYPPLAQNNTPSLPRNLQVDANSPNDLTSAVGSLNISEETTVKPEEHNIRRKPENAAKFHSPTRRKMALWPANEGIFSREDFPQLSSDSDSSGRSPASASAENMRDARLQSVVTSHADTRVGLGRASALLRNAQTPSVRLPGDNRPIMPSYIANSTYDRLQFPTDEELLSVPEIILASDLRGVPTGPRVRVSHQ